jgi:hypothetical protein
MCLQVLHNLFIRFFQFLCLRSLGYQYDKYEELFHESGQYGLQR